MDINELKPASYKARSSIETVPAETEEKRVKTVVPAETNKNNSLFHKFLKSFMQTDVETIKNNILDDYIVPGIKEVILGVINMIFYRDGVPRSGNSSDNGPYVSYRSSYRAGKLTRNDNQKNEHNRQHNFDYRELYWPTRGKAEAALASLWDILDDYHMVRIADVFDMAEATPTGDSTGNDYGWRDLSGSEVQRTYDGKYVIKLPTAVSLK